MRYPSYRALACVQCAACVGPGGQGKAGAEFADNPGNPPGAKVMSITPGGAFDRAGIEVGDIIVSINRVGVFGASAAYAAVRDAPTGVPVPVGLIDSRTGQHATFWVTF